MHYRAIRIRFAAGTMVAFLVLVSTVVHGQMSHMTPAGGQPAAPPPMRVTMSELHAHGGVPPG